MDSEFLRDIEEVAERDGRYDRAAYLFVYDALQHTVESLGKESLPKDQRHVSGGELLRGISEYALSQNYPNPFNAQTTISYAIPTASHVSLKVFNVLGEEVRTLVDADQQANTYQVTWDGRDAGGKQVASGVYFCKLQAGSFEGSTKMVFMK